jgi:NAD(P)-dependent dehydrogenase (short-subunit alcohol dehydrogenase family)
MDPIRGPVCRCDLSGKVALVTGGSRGIGRAIALRLAAAGSSVALAARQAPPLSAVAAEISKLKVQVTQHRVDLREHTSADGLVADVLRQHARLDILINNAGGSMPGTLTELDDAAWSDALELKLLGGMRVARAAWPALVKQSGSLISIVGIGGRLAEARGIIPAAQCSALYGMTKSMAALGLRDGVQVNAINPGPVWTDRLKSRLPALGIDSNLPEQDILTAMARKYNLRRIGRPEDIAELVAFILGPSGDLFQGAVIDFDGGAMRSI